MTNLNTFSNDLRCDYLLFIATTTEKEQLETVAEELKIPFYRKNGRLGRYYDLGTIGVSRVLAVKTEVGPFSYRGSASRAIYYKAETWATGLISLGMAFGIDPDTQNVGDVLVSKVLLPYDNRDILSENGKMKVDYGRVKPHKSKASLVYMLERESEKEEWRGKVSFGALLTGAARIYCKQYRDKLVFNCKKGNEPIIGGEMEGIGLLSASDPKSPSWVVVKGICDFADEKRVDFIEQSRPTACRNSTLFVLKALQYAKTTV